MPLGIRHRRLGAALSGLVLAWSTLVQAGPHLSSGTSPAAEIRSPSADCPGTETTVPSLVTPEALAALERCLAALPQTRDLYSKGGTYTPERDLLHRRILADATAGDSCVSGRAPIAVLTGGPPGAGKTTWLRRHAPMLLRPTTLRVDADELRMKLPEYRGWNAAITQDEVGDLVDRLLDAVGKPCLTDLIYDGTLSSARRYQRLIPRLKNLGYRVFLVNVLVPESVSRAQVLRRYQASGRYVPQSAISSYFSKGPAVFRQIAPQVDGYLQVNGLDGSVLDTGGAPLPSLDP
jgi:predicted ABC-type ATPase